MNRILIIEDEEAISELIGMNLEAAGYETVRLMDGLAAQAWIESYRRRPGNGEEQIALALVDVMLPGRDGFALLEDLKQADIPVIFLTAKSDVASRVHGLKSGAEDYMVKPFLPQELLLRVYAVLRRTYKEDSPLVVLDGCTIDFSRAQVSKGGEVIPLTAKEYTLLETLACSEGKIVTVDALCEALWGDNPFGYENSLNAHVRRIREKIEAEPSKPVSLITIKGLGYKLITRK